MPPHPGYLVNPLLRVARRHSCALACDAASDAVRIVSVAVDQLEYRIRRSDRARHARIVVDADGVEVVVPSRMALRHVEPFIASKRPWIDRTLRRYADARAEGPVRVDLRDGGTVPYLGEDLHLRVRVEPGRTRPHVARRGGMLVV
jgi:predicted metal-dependent hydrolase